MGKKTVFKLTGGLIVLLLMSFNGRDTALAGELWNKYSSGAKSLAGEMIGRISPGTGNYLKTTDFGIGSRVGNFIDNPASTLKGGASHIANGINGKLLNLSNLVGRSTGLWNVKPQGATFTAVNQRLPNAALVMISMNSTTIETPLNKSDKNLLSTNQSSDIFQNFSALSAALKKIGTNISHVTAIRGDIYDLNGSLKQKNAVIIDQNQIKNGLNNSNLAGKIIDVKQIDSQRSY